MGHQLPPRSCDEEWQVHSWIQVDPEVASSGQVQACDHLQQLPQPQEVEIEYYAMLAKNTGVHHYSGNNADLGTARGKFFRVSAVSITDPGDSDIIRTTMPTE